MIILQKTETKKREIISQVEQSFIDATFFTRKEHGKFTNALYTDEFRETNQFGHERHVFHYQGDLNQELEKRIGVYSCSPVCSLTDLIPNPPKPEACVRLDPNTLFAAMNQSLLVYFT